jgi:hypothetical protein
LGVEVEGGSIGTPMMEESRRKRRPRSVAGAEPMAVVADGVPRWRWRAGGGCGQVEGGGVVVN